MTAKTCCGWPPNGPHQGGCMRGQYSDSNDIEDFTLVSTEELEDLKRRATLYDEFQEVGIGRRYNDHFRQLREALQLEEDDFDADYAGLIGFLKEVLGPQWTIFGWRVNQKTKKAFDLHRAAKESKDPKVYAELTAKARAVWDEK